jgi:hypothetical protein
MFLSATPAKRALRLLLLLMHWTSTSTATATEETTRTSSVTPKLPPHILFILVDDLGWGDVGFHSPGTPEVLQTPTMDRLVQKEGMELNRHYVHSSCTGTRTSLQSGRFPVHVQTSLKNPEDPSSGMPRNLTGVAEHMKKANYATHYVGKWDVGMASPKHTPKGRGYDTSLNYFEHKVRIHHVQQNVVCVCMFCSLAFFIVHTKCLLLTGVFLSPFICLLHNASRMTIGHRNVRKVYVVVSIKNNN